MSTQSNNDWSSVDIEAAEDRRPKQQTELRGGLGLTLTTTATWSAAASFTTLDTTNFPGHPSERTLTGDTSPNSPFSKQYVPSTQSGSGTPSVVATSSLPSKETAGSEVGFSSFTRLLSLPMSALINSFRLPHWTKQWLLFPLLRPIPTTKTLGK